MCVVVCGGAFVNMSLCVAACVIHKDSDIYDNVCSLCSTRGWINKAFRGHE